MLREYIKTLVSVVLLLPGVMLCIEITHIDHSIHDIVHGIQSFKSSGTCRKESLLAYIGNSLKIYSKQDEDRSEASELYKVEDCLELSRIEDSCECDISSHQLCIMNTKKFYPDTFGAVKHNRTIYFFKITADRLIKIAGFDVPEIATLVNDMWWAQRSHSLRIWALCKPHDEPQILKFFTLSLPTSDKTSEVYGHSFNDIPYNAEVTTILKDYTYLGIQEMFCDSKYPLTLVGGYVPTVTNLKNYTPEDFKFMVTGISHFGSLCCPPQKLFVVHNSHPSLSAASLYLLHLHATQGAFLKSLTCPERLVRFQETSLADLKQFYGSLETGIIVGRKSHEDAFMVYTITPEATVVPLQPFILQKIQFLEVDNANNNILYCCSLEGNLVKINMESITDTNVPEYVCPEWLTSRV